ncbi:MAG TPA: histidine--tRNA ligase [bacterium]|nr:histidine--tRNA ligase [bacterium]
MARLYQNPKGTKDVLPEEQQYWKHIETTMQRVAELYGYEKLTLPIFEETALFRRGVGEGTDIVEKEMYTFSDKGGSSMTLRPEFTAGVVRAYLQNGMASRTRPVKLWSAGPVFRYERPQAGRYRQFTQFNVEAIGELDPALDFEIMSAAWHLYDALGFRKLNFQINSIGCPLCRPGYLRKLKDYYRGRLSGICDDCRTRIEKNPLRLLDCKNASCRPVIETAPSIGDCLCAECGDHFRTLRGYLDSLSRPYTVNPRLVRGLDYYTKTVFEVWAEGIGAQNAVCGGGRYDGLIELLGGPPTPAVGFAAGIERMVLTLQAHEISVPPIPSPKVYFVCLDDTARAEAVSLISRVRLAGVEAVMGFGGRSLKAQLREADRKGIPLAVILGSDEIRSQKAQVKHMQSGTQDMVPLSELPAFLTARTG